jgi:hypothetical protein
MGFGRPEVLIGSAVGGILLLWLAAWVAVCWVLWSAIGKVPRELRLLSPALVWLLLLPCFNVYWIFVVCIRVPRSLWSQLVGRQNRRDVGDCGETIGIIWCVANLLSILPRVGTIGLVAAIVVGIVFVVKIHRLARLIDTATTEGGAGAVAGTDAA